MLIRNPFRCNAIPLCIDVRVSPSSPVSKYRHTPERTLNVVVNFQDSTLMYVGSPCVQAAAAYTVATTARRESRHEKSEPPGDK